MKIKYPTLIVLFSCLFLLTFSQCTTTITDSGSGVFWEILGNGLEKPSFMLGTLHRAGAKSIIDSIPSIIVKLKSVEQICPESDITLMPVLKKNTEKLVEKKDKSFLKPWPSDSTYENVLTSEQLEKLLTLIPSEYPENYLQLFRPIELLKFIQNQRDNETYRSINKIEDDSIRTKAFIAYSDSVMNLDEMLLYTAKRNKTKIVPLDSASTRREINDQMNASLPEVSYKQEMEALMYYVENHKDIDSLKLVAEKSLLQAYLSQDFNYLCGYTGLYSEANDFLKLINLDSEGIEFVLSLIVDYRNNFWMKKIPTLIHEKSTFIIVGASHLCGETGLINQLRKKGYRVEPIKK